MMEENGGDDVAVWRRREEEDEMGKEEMMEWGRGWCLDVWGRRRREKRENGFSWVLCPFV